MDREAWWATIWTITLAWQVDCLLLSHQGSPIIGNKKLLSKNSLLILHLLLPSVDYEFLTWLPSLLSRPSTGNRWHFLSITLDEGKKKNPYILNVKPFISTIQPFSLSCIAEWNGNPLQCSCLESPRDGAAWWAAVYGVKQSRTRLKWLSSSSSSMGIFIKV